MFVPVPTKTSLVAQVPCPVPPRVSPSVPEITAAALMPPVPTAVTTPDVLIVSPCEPLRICNGVAASDEIVNVVELNPSLPYAVFVLSLRTYSEDGPT